MVVLGVIKVLIDSKFRCDCWVVRSAQLGLKRHRGLLCLIKVGLVLQVETGSILGAKIIPLPHALGWIMTFPEGC